MSHEPPRKDPRVVGALSIAMGLLVVPGLCTLALSAGHGSFAVLLALVAAALFFVGGLIMLNAPKARPAPPAHDPALGRMATDRAIAAASQSMTPRQRAANWGAVLLIILVLLLAFIFGR